jgi:hypothetical protein
MDALEESCREAAHYPTNLVLSGVSQLVLEATKEELHEHADRLFCDETSASVDFLEIGKAGDGELRKPLEVRPQV